MNFLIKIFEVAYVEGAPGPQLFWMSEWGKKFKLSFQILLIMGKDKTLLINTGLTRELLSEVNKIWASNGEDGKLIETDNIINILKKENLKPGDIDFVLITPFQHYSMGYLDIFKNAKICLSKRGWLDFHNKKYNNEIRKLVIPPRILNYLMSEGWENVDLLEDEDYIVKGISTFWCGGHHRSSIAVKIEASYGTIIISDCIFRLKNIEENIPIGLSENIYECFDSYRRIREEADIVIPLYDPDNFIRFKNGIVLPKE
jgi:glyoxylase-like metal-dependent hydrolase (beta-lactamase superfamily II)